MAQPYKPMRPRKRIDRTLTGYAKPDTTASTYLYKVTFKNGSSELGYSKKANIPELPDKQKLLTMVITGLFNNGYMNPDKMDFIEIYDTCLGSSRMKLIITLKKSSYQIVGNPAIIKFLDKFYATVINSSSELFTNQEGAL